jgi:serine phosphatase RsbU (regulator of sigma subunit)/PAS domain-containing protein
MKMSPGDLARLASFPEQNPNPVIEISVSGEMVYMNPAAKQYFPDLIQKGLGHPLFSVIKEQLDTSQRQDLNDFKCEVIVNEHVFEQKVFYLRENELLRVYSSDITERKATEQKLANLALFPEQNPNPVIEGDVETGRITYMNPAALRRFPELKDLGSEHDLFSEIRQRLHSEKDFQCVVSVGSFIFEQKIYFIPGTKLIRVYSHDITEQKKTEKNLARLASFPEQNPSPIIEISLDGHITYTNPACRSRFATLVEKLLHHEILQPFMERFGMFRNGTLEQYEVEIRLGDHYFAQRAKILPENQVIRIFNLDITEQKRNEEIIREKNKDITDSINYARKIQHAILPPVDILKNAFSDSFVLYQPKDIISGDFYWFSNFDDVTAVVCADCTGHGVPGALMSMIGSNLISHIVNERNVYSPGAALKELDHRVRVALKQDEEDTESRDGMDMAMVVIQPSKMLLQYAGAHRPFVLIRNGELTEIAASKFAIGGRSTDQKNYADHEIALLPGDCIYLYTDGIIDQFGGPQGKKYMKKRFYESLIAMNGLEMEEQRFVLLSKLNDWKGRLEQVDDVQVIGIRF